MYGFFHDKNINLILLICWIINNKKKNFNYIILIIYFVLIVSCDKNIILVKKNCLFTYPDAG